MAVVRLVFVHLAAGLTAFALLAALFWGWDERIGRHRAAALGTAIATRGSLAVATDACATLLRSLAGPAVGFGSLAGETLIASLVMLAVVGLFAGVAIPRIFVAMLVDPFARWLLFRQILFAGLVPVWAASFVIWSATGVRAGRIAAASPSRTLGIAGVCLVLGLAVFTIVTGGIYVLFAEGAGSFGGEWRTALRVVPESLAYAIAFRGLSGIYVYSVLAAGLPGLFVALIKLSVRAGPIGRTVRKVMLLSPENGRPLRTIGLVLAAAASVAGGLASLIAHAAGGGLLAKAAG